MAGGAGTQAAPRWVVLYFGAITRARWFIIVAWLALTACGGWKAADFFDSTSGNPDKVGVSA